MKWKQRLHHLQSSNLNECHSTIRPIFTGKSNYTELIVLSFLHFIVHRSDRKGPNLATFYYRHLDTDSEQESQKKAIVETEVKTSESSEEEEWTYSSNTTKEIKKPEVPVSFAERANIEQIKALVENVNWSVTNNKHSEKLWMSGSGIKKRIFRQETADPEVIYQQFFFTYKIYIIRDLMSMYFFRMKNLSVIVVMPVVNTLQKMMISISS